MEPVSPPPSLVDGPSNDVAMEPVPPPPSLVDGPSNDVATESVPVPDVVDVAMHHIPPPNVVPQQLLQMNDVFDSFPGSTLELPELIEYDPIFIGNRITNKDGGVCIFKYGSMVFAVNSTIASQIVIQFSMKLTPPLPCQNLHCGRCHGLCESQSEFQFHYSRTSCPDTTSATVHEWKERRAINTPLIPFVDDLVLQVLINTTLENNDRLDVLDPSKIHFFPSFNLGHYKEEKKHEREYVMKSKQKPNLVDWVLNKHNLFLLHDNVWRTNHMSMSGVPELLYMPFIKHLRDWPLQVLNSYGKQKSVSTFLSGKESRKHINGLYD